MPVLAAYMVPHPPMIVPQIGKGSEKQITETIQAYEEVASEIAGLRPETIIISSPHSVLYADYFHVSPGKVASGDFGSFTDEKLRTEIYDEFKKLGFAYTALDLRGYRSGSMNETLKKE